MTNQPKIIKVDDKIRLRAYDGNYMLAVPWYQDETVYYNSEGITDPREIPDAEYVKAMYDYLSVHGELYFIEVLEGEKYIPIGDVTLKEENPPIAIGVAKYRGAGIGAKVLKTILQRAKKLEITKIHGTIIYDYNLASQRIYEKLGFKLMGIKENKKIYELELHDI